MADITLPVQPVFDVPRSFFDKVVPGTLINGQVHFSSEQCCDLMEVSQQNWSKRMAARETAEHNLLQLQVVSAFNTTYSIPVQYPSGAKYVHFHHPLKLLEEAVTIRNTEKRNRLVNWLINIGSEVIQQGFVIDQHALQNDLTVAPRMRTQLQPLWPSWREGICILNNTLVYDINNTCVDLYLPDGSFDQAKANRTARNIHGNLYMSQHGKPAKMVFKERADAKYLSAGTQSHLNPGYPATHELLNVHNYLYESEIQIRHGNLARIIGYIGNAKRAGTIITTEVWERASVMLTSGEFNPAPVINGLVSYDLYSYKRRIMYRYADGLTREQVNAFYQGFPQEYDTNFFERNNWTAEECQRFAHFYDLLMYELTDCMDENGNVVLNNNAANYPIESQVVQSSGFDI